LTTLLFTFIPISHIEKKKKNIARCGKRKKARNSWKLERKGDVIDGRQQGQQCGQPDPQGWRKGFG